MNKKILGIVIMMLLFLPVYSAAGISHNNNDNNPPNPPEINGPASGQIKTTYIYYFTVTDPDEDDKLLTLEINWGDETQSETCGCDKPWENGEIVEVENRWNKQGNYDITARVQDVYGEWSEWSGPFSVSMPKSRERSNIFINLYENLIRFFPLFERIINIIL